MKPFLLAIAVILLLSSCDKNNKTTANASLPGVWKEYEYLIDPGNGSGTWQPKAGFIIQINKDFTYITNSDNTFWGRSGTLADVTENSFSIKPPYANYRVTYQYQFKEGVLEVWYMCIEGCGSRFKKD